MTITPSILPEEGAARPVRFTPEAVTEQRIKFLTATPEESQPDGDQLF